ncbi:MAG: sialidase family protein, partial [Polyangiales bacterium]
APPFARAMQPAPSHLPMQRGRAKETPALFTPTVEFGRHQVAVIRTRQVVPGPGLPQGLALAPANSNLDVTRHDGRVYLAWRNAPGHVASRHARIHVISSADERHWQHEVTLHRDRDVREPRLLSFGGTLRLFFAELGRDPLAFEPRGTAVWQRGRGEQWHGEPGLRWPGLMPWRTRTVGGQAHLIGYRGGEHLYAFNGEPLSIVWLSSDDGEHWRPAAPAQETVLRGGGSEADFGQLPDGSLRAVVRNEAGDDDGFGSKLCRATPDAPTDWHCRPDPRKFDSPLVFAHDGELYLIARRNLSPSGHYAQASHGPRASQSAANALDYLSRRKRCALWRFTGPGPNVAFILDLPSRGDTCFAGILKGNAPGDFIVYDYSSDLHGPDLSWYAAQKAPSHIYRHTLRFSRRPTPTPVAQR